MYSLQAVAMGDLVPQPSHSPSPALPSSSGPQTRAAKGKQRAVPAAKADAPLTPSVPGPRGTKRPSDTDLVTIEDDETTPRKADGPPSAGVPRVQVDDASPPPPARRPRTDAVPMVATGDVCVIYLDDSLHAYHWFRICVGLARRQSVMNASLRSTQGDLQLHVNSVRTRGSAVHTHTPPGQREYMS